MAPKHNEAQDLARKVYLEARRIVLRDLGKALSELDSLYASDAAKLKTELRRILRLSGLPDRQVSNAIDEIFKASRAKRVGLVEGAIRSAAKVAAGLDQATFTAIFGAEAVASAVPLADRRSDSPPKPTRWLRPVRGSEEK